MDEGLTKARLDRLTVSVAAHLTQQGIDGFQYNECLNALRMGLCETFEFVGLTIPADRYHHTCWSCVRGEKHEGCSR